MLTPAGVRSLLATHGLRPSRALGQHFLADSNTARKVVRLAELEPGAKVLEIGPGLGSLTLALAEAGAHVLALELDQRLVPVLEEVVEGCEQVTVERGDALDWDYAERLRGSAWICVSNLPYNVATPVVVKILEEVPTVHRLLVMVQREVGERLAASPGSREYGAVSVKVSYHGMARMVGTVPPTVFVPKPKVESALVRIDRRECPAVDVPSYEALFALVRAGFAQRRKMLRRALRRQLGARTDAVLDAAGIAPTSRAESLGLDEWGALARAAAA